MILQPKFTNELMYVCTYLLCGQNVHCSTFNSILAPANIDHRTNDIEKPQRGN